MTRTMQETCERRAIAAALSACTFGLATLGYVSPAAAALPALACNGGFPMNTCLANVVSAGMANRDTKSFWYPSPVRLEIVYYPNQDADAVVLGQTDFFTEVWPYPYAVIRTPGAWTIQPGWYCPRLYWLQRGLWDDEFCLSDTGSYWPGKVGYLR